MAKPPFNYIQVTNGEDTIKAPTNLHAVAGATPGVYVAEGGAKGIIEPGESSAEARPRAFANGSVLNLRDNFAGKIFNLKFLITADHKENLRKIERIIRTPRVFIKSDWNNNTEYTCQFQKNGYTLEYDISTNSFEASLIFAAEGAF